MGASRSHTFWFYRTGEKFHAYICQVNGLRNREAYRFDSPIMLEYVDFNDIRARNTPGTQFCGEVWQIFVLNLPLLFLSYVFCSSRRVC